MTVKTTSYPNVPQAPEFAPGEIVVGDSNGILVLVTGTCKRKRGPMFAGTVLHKGASNTFKVGEHNDEWLKSSFMPFHGAITMESTP